MMFAASIHACLSVAYMSPRYQDIVYGQVLHDCENCENMVTIIITPSSVIKMLSFSSFQPTEVFVQVMEGEGWGPKTPSENKTSVKVKMVVKMVVMVVMVNIITLTIFFI